MFGRSGGDDLLRSVAALLVQTLHQVDTVARLSGDECMVLLPGIHEPEDAVRVAEKLRLTLCEAELRRALVQGALRLQAWGCDQRQGCLFAAPLGEEQCLAFLASRNQGP